MVPMKTETWCMVAEGPLAGTLEPVAGEEFGGGLRIVRPGGRAGPARDERVAVEREQGRVWMRLAA